MASAYPSYTPIVDNVDFPEADDLNQLYLDVVSIARGVPIGAHVNREEISATKTLVDGDFTVQSLDLDTDRQVTLPANASTNHPFYFWNRSAFILTVKDASANTIIIIPPASGGFVFPDAQGWTGIAGIGVNPEFTTIELGHADDTTITRNSAGVVAVEGAALATQAYVGSALIATADLGSDTVSFDLTSIPATFKHLRLILSLRTDNAAQVDTIGIRFNNDSGANYDSLFYIGSHSGSFLTNEYLAANEMTLSGVQGANSPANHFSPIDIFIPNYAGTNTYKATYASGHLFKSYTTGNMTIRTGTGIWKSTAAITRITLFPGTGSNWKQYSSMSLYGMS